MNSSASDTMSEATYKCQHCDQSYTRKFSLMAHTLVHNRISTFRDIPRPPVTKITIVTPAVPKIPPKATIERKPSPQDDEGSSDDECSTDVDSFDEGGSTEENDDSSWKLEDNKTPEKSAYRLTEPMDYGPFEVFPAEDVKNGVEERDIFTVLKKEVKKWRMPQRKKQRLVKHFSAMRFGWADLGPCCPFCREKFKGRDHRRFHLFKNHIGFPFQCKLCGTGERSRLYIDKHMSLHLGRSDVQEGFQCHLCNKKLKSRRTLRTHIIKLHYAGCPFHCHLCPKRFHLKREMKAHLENSHPDFAKFTCDFCGGKFRELGQLKKHIENGHLKRIPT